MKPYILILGATSDIALAIAHLYASKGYSIYLAARNVDRLDSDAKDLHIRYEVDAKLIPFDATEYDTHSKMFQQLDPQPEKVFCVFGYLGDQEVAETNWKEAHQIIAVNYTGAVSILNVCAEEYKKKKKGSIIGISSVAGERGRGSNFMYGSAKAGFTAYLSGLRNKLYASGVHVLTVKPGFVDTSMTEGLDLPAPITASPQEVAKDIFRAEQKKRNVLYTRWMWRYIMWIIRNIPEGIFKKLSL